VQRAVAPAIGSAAGQGAAVAASRGEREHFPSWDAAAAAISGDQQSATERADAAAKAQQRQQQELKEINDACGGNFASLDKGDKAKLALKLTFSRTFLRSERRTGRCSGSPYCAASSTLGCPWQASCRGSA
jgi:hypothetical protein